jgi:hypothetical protein
VTVVVPSPVSICPELQALPIFERRLSGLLAVQEIDSRASVDSASAPTNAYPVWVIPLASTTLMLSKVAVVVPDLVW